MARADFNVRTGKVAWRYTAPAALFFAHGSLATVRGNFPGCHGPQLDRTSFRPPKAAGSAADLNRANVPAGARMHAPLHRVAVAIVVIGIAVGVVVIGVEAEPSKSTKAAVVIKPVVEATAMESATRHRSAVKSATAKSGPAAKTTGVETASTQTAAVETAATKAAAVEATAATAKAATTVASASTASSAG